MGVAATAAVACLLAATPAAAQSDTVLTYQGSLADGAAPASGNYDVAVSLWDEPSGGTQVAGPVVFDDLAVSGGLLTMQLDFGAAAFDNGPRWLEIGVNGTILSPRQPITRAPYALQTRGIFVDSAGSIGIGTTAPPTTLTVTGPNNTGPAAAAIELTNTTAGSGRSYLVGSSSEGLFQIADMTAGGATLMAVTSAGHIGIGTTDPTAPLHIASTNPSLTLQDSNDSGAAQEGYISLVDSAGVETAWLGFVEDTNLYLRNNIGDVVVRPDHQFLVTGGLMAVQNTGDQSPLLRFLADRLWEFRQDGSGASADLKLQSIGFSGDRNLIIQTGGSVVYRNQAERELARVTTNTVDAGFITTNGPGGSRNTAIGSTSPERGGIWVFNEFGDPKAAIFVNPLDGDGVVSADVKAFRVPNPRDKATEIMFACVEGPEAAAYVRGTAMLTDGRATVTLPEYFLDVAVAEGMTVQITPRSANSKGLAVIDRSVERFEVRELLDGRGSYEFDWEVKAVRRGHEHFQVIRPRMTP